MKAIDILESEFKKEFGDDYATELRDFEHGFSQFYDCSIRAISEALNNNNFPDVIFSFLKNAKCPDCDGSGAIVVETMRTGTRWVDDGNGNPLPEPVPETDYDVEPCQWCYEKDLLLSKKLEVI